MSCGQSWTGSYLPLLLGIPIPSLMVFGTLKTLVSTSILAVLSNYPWGTWTSTYWLADTCESLWCWCGAVFKFDSTSQLALAQHPDMALSVHHAHKFICHNLQKCTRHIWARQGSTVYHRQDAMLQSKHVTLMPEKHIVRHIYAALSATSHCCWMSPNDMITCRRK